MNKIPRISETEWEIMKIVWAADDPLQAGEIIGQLQASDPSWHPKTAKTLLNRLVKKGALGYEKRGRGYLYFPLAEEKAVVKAVSESFLERVFGGALQPMLAHFVQSKRMSKREIEDLRKLLDKKK